MFVCSLFVYWYCIYWYVVRVLRHKRLAIINYHEVKIANNTMSLKSPWKSQYVQPVQHILYSYQCMHTDESEHLYATDWEYSFRVWGPRPTSTTPWNLESSWESCIQACMFAAIVTIQYIIYITWKYSYVTVKLTHFCMNTEMHQ